MFKHFKQAFGGSIERIELAVSDLPGAKRARRRRAAKRAAAWGLAAVGAYVAFAVLLALVHIGLIASSVNHANRGRIALTESINLVKLGEVDKAVSRSQSAVAEFGVSSENIHELDGTLLDKLPVVKDQIGEVTHLVDALERISRGAAGGIALLADLKSVTQGNAAATYASFSTDEKRKFLDKFYAGAPELNGMRANFELALLELRQMKLHGIFWPVKYKILEAEAKLSLGVDVLKELVPLSQILPELAGYPDKSSFLVLLQNQDELRPTGGFIGTYGILETANGDIERFDTHDVYHMDMPVQDKLNVVPPEPIKLYLNKRWFMRDSNWSPDWPTSASQVQWFYDTENKLLSGKNRINNFDGRFNGVIAVNPGFVVGLLELVGPIKIGEETYTADNFTQLLEYKVERGYAVDGVPSWQRKEVIGEIVKEIKIRLLNLPSSRWADVVAVAGNAFKKKEVLLYLNDHGLQKLIVEQGWGGEIKATDSDYLYWVDSNFASLKTDAVITREFKYSVKPVDSRLLATLEINYRHEGKAPDWRTSRYKDYARIYVPLGSKLVSYDGATVPVAVSQENGKTVFGSLFYVEMNSTKTVRVSYYLPVDVAAQYHNGLYRLYWQKQPSSRVTGGQVDVMLPARVQSISPDAAEIDSANRVKWKTGLTSDQEFRVNFK